MNYAQAFLMSNMNAFPAHQVPILQRELEQLDDQSATALMMTELKNPTVALVFAILLGELGVDRFYIGHKETGIAKLALFVVSFITLFILIGIFLLIGLYVWKLVDCFLIMGACRQANFERVMLQIQQMKAFQHRTADSTQTEVKTEVTVEPVVTVEPTIEIVEPIIHKEEVVEVEETDVPAVTEVPEQPVKEEHTEL